MKIHFIAMTAAAMLLFSGGAGVLCAQDAIQAPVSEEMEVSLVSLFASVRDSKDKPVKGLKQSDFVLTNDGKPLEIAQFSGDPAEPVSVAFLLDTSGSMRLGDKYGLAERIVDAVLDRLAADDEASLITFGDEKIQTIVELTKVKQDVSNKLAGQKLWGPTALWDAIIFTQKLVIKDYGKKAVILISDGFDNRSGSVFKRAVDEASRVLLPVYVCEIAVEDEDAMRELNFDSPLKDFAEATGAQHFAISDEDDKAVKKVAERLVEELRNQYFIGVSGGAVGPSPNLQLTVKNGSYHVRLQHSLQNQ